MDASALKSMLEQVRDGALGIDDAMARMRHMPFEDIGFAKVDHHRAIRHGMPEVIFGKGKAPEHIVAIAEKVLERSSNLLCTRTEPRAADMVMARISRADLASASAEPMSGAWKRRSPWARARRQPCSSVTARPAW